MSAEAPLSAAAVALAPCDETLTLSPHPRDPMIRCASEHSRWSSRDGGQTAIEPAPAAD